MKDTPNPNVGDIIEVVTDCQHSTKIKTKVLLKGPMSMPQFNYWVVLIDGKRVKTSYNPMIEAFTIPDYTD